VIIISLQNAPLREVKATQPEPFKLAIEERGEEHHQKFLAKLEEEKQEEQEKANFKAKPYVPAVPFEPQKSTKALTLVSDVVLNSDVRAVNRQNFEVQKVEKMKAADEARKKQEEQEKVQ
jgi:hypothetical protein